MPYIIQVSFPWHSCRWCQISLRPSLRQTWRTQHGDELKAYHHIHITYEHSLTYTEKSKPNYYFHQENIPPKRRIFYNNQHSPPYPSHYISCSPTIPSSLRVPPCLLLAWVTSPAVFPFSATMGGSQSVQIPGGGMEGYHVLRVRANNCYINGYVVYVDGLGVLSLGWDYCYCDCILWLLFYPFFICVCLFVGYVHFSRSWHTGDVKSTMSSSIFIVPLFCSYYSCKFPSSLFFRTIPLFLIPFCHS